MFHYRFHRVMIPHMIPHINSINSINMHFIEYIEKELQFSFLLILKKTGTKVIWMTYSANLKSSSMLENIKTSLIFLLLVRKVYRLNYMHPM